MQWLERIKCLFMGHEWRLRYVKNQWLLYECNGRISEIPAVPAMRVAVICDRCGKGLDLR